MKEADVLLQCREADKALVEAAIPKVVKEYEERRGTSVQITLYTQRYLPAETSGGILLSALNGRIRCNNTFEARLRYPYELALPEIRKLLFGETDRTPSGHQEIL